MMSRTETEREADRKQAFARFNEGYPLPALPDIAGWTTEFDEFARAFSRVVKQRFMDCYRLNVSDETHIRCRLDLSLIDAALEGRDVSLISAYHRMLFSAPTPEDIKPALNVISSVHRGLQLTSDHVAAYAEIRDALNEWKDSHPRASTEDALFPLVQLCYEEFSPTRVAMIVALIGRGIHTKDGARASLLTFVGIESPLMDGAL